MSLQCLGWAQYVDETSVVVKVATCQNFLPLQPWLAAVLVKEIGGVEGEVLY